MTPVSVLVRVNSKIGEVLAERQEELRKQIITQRNTRADQDERLDQPVDHEAEQPDGTSNPRVRHAANNYRRTYLL